MRVYVVAGDNIPFETSIRHRQRAENFRDDYYPEAYVIEAENRADAIAKASVQKDSSTSER